MPPAGARAMTALGDASRIRRAELVAGEDNGAATAQGRPASFAEVMPQSP